MHPIDRAVMEHCQADFRPVTALKGQIPAGTLYRHVTRLVALGWLEKQGSRYRTTPAGQRQIEAALHQRSWTVLEAIYPPLALVPTPTHRATAELILAAVVARQHEVRADRHPYVVVYGDTLRWKSSLGVFICLMLGLDPALHVVDCGAESGKSVAIRRGGAGAIVFERQLLHAPFVTFDEFLTASPDVRAALGVFLSGRLAVAFENQQLTVRPVPLLTLNPRPRPTLEQQIGLSAPQIRRAILVNLDAVTMPDLARSGERALEAARAHPPLPLRPPAVDCRAFHDRIVDLVRAILAPGAHARVDVEIVVNLATGMTAFIPDPTAAIAQVGYDLGIVAETLSWTTPGWIEAVTAFEIHTPVKGAASFTTVPARRSDSPDRDLASEPADTLTLAVRQPGRPKGHVPDLSLTDATRMRLVWFAHETGRDVDGGLDLVLDFYLEWRANQQTLETMEQILALARELEVTGLEPDMVREYLADRRLLEEYNCSFTDLPEARQVLDLLGQLPVAWDWDTATAAMQAVAAIIAAGIPMSEIEAFIARHQRLEALGFAATAEALATALTEAGAVGEQREAVIRHVVENAVAVVAREHLEAHASRLQGEVADLQAQRAQLETTIAALAQHRDTVRRDIAAAQIALAQVEAERVLEAGGLEVLAAFKAFLFQKTAATDAFFAELRTLDRWQTIGGTPDDVVGAAHIRNLRAKLVALLLEMFRQAGPAKPSS